MKYVLNFKFIVLMQNIHLFFVFLFITVSNAMCQTLPYDTVYYPNGSIYKIAYEMDYFWTAYTCHKYFEMSSMPGNLGRNYADTLYEGKRGKSISITRDYYKDLYIERHWATRLNTIYMPPVFLSNVYLTFDWPAEMDIKFLHRYPGAVKPWGMELFLNNFYVGKRYGLFQEVDFDNVIGVYDFEYELDSLWRCFVSLDTNHRLNYILFKSNIEGSSYYFKYHENGVVKTYAIISPDGTAICEEFFENAYMKGKGKCKYFKAGTGNLYEFQKLYPWISFEPCPKPLKSELDAY